MSHLSTPFPTAFHSPFFFLLRLSISQPPFDNYSFPAFHAFALLVRPAPCCLLEMLSTSSHGKPVAMAPERGIPRPHTAELPLEVMQLICQASDRQGLLTLHHVSTSWRHLSLPFLWKAIEISEWEYKSSALEIHSAYSKYVQAIEYRQYQRRRGHSHNTQAMATLPAVDGKTKTETLCEWLGARWPAVRRVEIGAWPPYNVHRVQVAIADACPKLSVLILEGAAAAWADTLQRAVTLYPNMCGLHITEDKRALLPPAADGPYQQSAHPFRFLAQNNGTHLTHLTAPCLVDSISHLLRHLPTLLPALESLDLRQVDAGVTNRLHINVPPKLTDLKISGQHPLSMRIFENRHDGNSLSAGDRLQRSDLLLRELARRLHSLTVTGPRSEEAARREYEQFWSAIFRHKWTSLTRLVVPVARPEFGMLITQHCPAMESLRFLRAGSAINRQQNDQWVGELTRSRRLYHLDIASSNNEYEGCVLSSSLATEFKWQAPWLHTLYLSRLHLSLDSLDTLLRMLPFLHTLWFTFDATGDRIVERPLAIECRIRYLIIHAICTDAESPLTSAPPASGVDSRGLDALPGSGGAVSRSAAALATCLRHFPSLSRCRLPMFTFPDEHRHWLQCQLPTIEFKKYAPPY
ncbi:hypothetical protein GQ54DRAFT_41082 [Martensiomyces pterosporus]|nr:hypothetical protein GQ54DRAFT_41082 [Martensiomyces pterosporus]